MNKVYAVVVAAGKGTRMNLNVSKQFVNINGKPLLYYTLDRFCKNDNIDGIVLVTLEDKIDYCIDKIIKKYNISKIIDVVSGGSSRQESVYKGLKALPKDCETVLIHDAARPFINDKIIDDGIKYSKIHGACTCGVKPKDTIKLKGNKGFSLNTPNRDELFMVQTPQCFNYDLILDCHEKLKVDKFDVTDDTMIVEKYNNPVYLYEGSYSNIKITTPEDLVIAEKILNNLK
ncbi:2-C-methyl-D-erythritol 4-phosphate cytidylyltransferase [Clostridium oceanicum]|uniref:2-C-methyl-D-erythritol 4-phosphate cytidylyltransferase n=1 Tax=Clostridium oceanicum TaxID=1543 RepID=A0ABN1JSE5_9CLOT